MPTGSPTAHHGDGRARAEWTCGYFVIPLDNLEWSAGFQAFGLVPDFDTLRRTMKRATVVRAHRRGRPGSCQLPRSETRRGRDDGGEELGIICPITAGR
jgi:hypothetical protein